MLTRLLLRCSLDYYWEMLTRLLKCSLDYWDAHETTEMLTRLLRCSWDYPSATAGWRKGLTDVLFVTVYAIIISMCKHRILCARYSQPKASRWWSNTKRWREGERHRQTDRQTEQRRVVNEATRRGGERERERERETHTHTHTQIET